MSDIPITVIVSAFVPYSRLDETADLLARFEGCRGISKDASATAFTQGYGVAQAYVHFRSASANVAESIATRRKIFDDAAATLLAMVGDDDFASMAVYWLSAPGLLSTQDLASSGMSAPTSVRSILATFDQGSFDQGSAEAFFIKRPSHETAVPIAVTLIEIPESTPEACAVGLAFHEDGGFRTPLCLLDLLTCKASWLRSNLVVTSQPTDESQGPSIESQLHAQFEAVNEHLQKAFQGDADPGQLIRLTDSMAAAQVRIAAFKMNTAMMSTVKRQLKLFNDDFPNFQVRETSPSPNGVFFPIQVAMNQINAATADAEKFKKLFDGVAMCMAAAKEMHSLRSEQESARQERAVQRNFNVITLVLAAAAIGISFSAMVDTETARYFLQRQWPGWTPSIGYILLEKVIICVAAAVMTAMLIFLIHWLREKEILSKLRRKRRGNK